MRFYSFVNALYLSQLQRGLQTAHAVSEMSIQFANVIWANQRTKHDLESAEAYLDWAKDHKTIIICDGGNVAMLEDLYTTLIDHAYHFGLPLVKFYEDEASLNGALTVVGIIVPAELYDTKYRKPEDGVTEAYTYESLAGGSINYFVGTPEFEFIKYLKSFRLAQS